jgi:hypothetical protein
MLEHSLSDRADRHCSSIQESATVYTMKYRTELGIVGTDWELLAMQFAG